MLAVPAYWVFGRRKFEGYVLARKPGAGLTEQIPDELKEKYAPYISDYGDSHPETRAAEKLASIPLRKGNYGEVRRE